MSNLRFAMFGTGFWSRFQLAGWYEAGGVECVALYNRTRAKAEQLGQAWNIDKVYSDGEAEALLDNEQLDFVDICTNVETHYPFVKLAAERKLPVVCQKPMATTLAECEAMVAACREANVPLFINENWRWQQPLRDFKRMLDSGRIGKPFRARIHYVNSFPVFDNQPFLKELEQFILTDIGSHILDAARFLFGDAQTLYAHTYRAHPDIKGEDVATVMMTMGDDALTVVCEMSYASRTEIERFPETYVYVEGHNGFLELGPDFWIRETTADGTLAKRYPPPRYPWADPAYDLIHASIVPTQADFVQALRGEGAAETTGDDNLKTMQLVFGSYESAASGQVITLPFTAGAPSLA
ncbi:MAG: Gfo/Idh/MocA family oxidoreductase [Chloroflexi bacterium]|nr:Gfo/Idh/MocA family oxidoreductase [Chloroflexota bacterium]